ncbi:STN domain-containing protein [Methylosinus sp. H3A]|uniref:STN domain-containing protein n=1 Tax=Methylosinus sp. H3A TaxID=2785786 RepID=UPI0018C2FA5C|nr:STN domain-containing protein [Methylosinus sp. H3A]MBG0812398.1 STN domain-containing protein [Methylosinus sp. H3A]
MRIDLSAKRVSASGRGASMGEADRIRAARASFLPSFFVMAWVAAFAYAASAQDEGARQESFRFYDIPAQSLASALEAYGQAAGVQVLFESRSAAGRRSAPLHGSFTADAALERLLAGTDVKVRYVGPNAITLEPLAALFDLPPAHPLASADMSLDPLQVQASRDGDQELALLRDYSDAVRSDIERALRRNARTRSGNYRIGVKLWVDDARRVERAQLFQSTGDSERDAAVSASLQGLLISRDAPTHLPLPVRVLVVVKSLK